MRRALRLVALVLALAIALALVGSLLLRVHAARRLEQAQNRFQTEVGSLDIAAYVPDPVAEAENGARWFVAGAQALILSDADWDLVNRRIRTLGEPWPPQDQEAIVALLEAQSGALELLQRAGELDSGDFGIDYERWFEAELPNFVELLQAGRVLAVRCDWEEQSGDLEAATATLRTLERLAATQLHEPPVIGLLAGSAVERIYLDRLESLLQRIDDPAELQRLRADLDHLSDAALDPRVPFSADIAVTSAWIRERGPFTEATFVANFDPEADAVLRGLLRRAGYADLVAAVQLEAAMAMLARWEDPLAEAHEAAFLPDGRRRSWVPGADRLAAFVTPNFSDAMRRAQATRSARALARTALDLRQTGLEAGAYPPRLEDPPVSEYSGETATYRVGDDGAEIAFPAAERAWEDLMGPHAVPRRGLMFPVTLRLRWRLPPLG